MAITPTYPGVYIEELPSPVHTIAGVATSITAFVGYTGRGIDNRAERILSFSDFELLSAFTCGRCFLTVFPVALLSTFLASERAILG